MQDTSKAPRRRVPRRSTPRRLRAGALHHLKRYPATSSGRLREILARRVRRSERIHGTDTPSLMAAIEEIIGEFTERGFLNDRALADAVIRSRRRQGKAWAAVRQALFAKRIPSQIREQAVSDGIAAEREAGDDPDLDAAWRFARRKRLGPFKPDGRSERWKKDMGKMARAGHGYGVCRAVLEAEEIPDRYA